MGFIETIIEKIIIKIISNKCIDKSIARCEIRVSKDIIKINIMFKKFILDWFMYKKQWVDINK